VGRRMPLVPARTTAERRGFSPSVANRIGDTAVLEYRSTETLRSSARCCWTLRVSVDSAARPSPYTRGKSRLLDVGRRILARDRFAPDSPLEGDGFEPSVPKGVPSDPQ